MDFSRKLPIGIQSFEKLRTDKFLYVDKTEDIFNLVHSAKEAIAQIEAQNYAAPYSADKRKLFRIGVNFSTEEQNINEWEVT